MNQKKPRPVPGFFYGLAAKTATPRSVVMTTFAMHVAVRQFFFAGITHIDDLHIEIQTLAGQGMVAIDHHVIAFNITDGDDLHAAIRAGRMELHAHFEFLDALEHGAV